MPRISSCFLDTDEVSLQPNEAVRVLLYYDETGAKNDEGEREARGTFLMLPEGVKFSRGDTITIRAVQENHRYRCWYPVTAWDPWRIAEDDSVSVMVVPRMGDFLMMDGESSYRSVIGRTAE